MLVLLSCNRLATSPLQGTENGLQAFSLLAHYYRSVLRDAYTQEVLNTTITRLAMAFRKNLHPEEGQIRLAQVGQRASERFVIWRFRVCACVLGGWLMAAVSDALFGVRRSVTATRWTAFFDPLPERYRSVCCI